ncbi:hypothetical protein CCICO_08750 [Corynebacterium ciconiae DSM 44920]|uniref:hypothetical protein n=1 Tax=Corynebacterium ciconiae TaxID=227319 RepID=UPI000373B6D0|nr:hypothetical protein [Corynebacterium ciconiae]WKD61759.1 hypothetical protein CCICO_08750 [Corynebacterium ciconiae DSM 44920]
MSFVLQIQEIVEGPIKDLYVEAGSSLPTFAPNFVPEQLDFSGAQFSTEWGSDGQQFSTDWGSDDLISFGDFTFPGAE